MKEADTKYIKRKLRDIEGYIAVATGAVSMISIMEGRVTDGAIKVRDEMTAETIKAINQIIKRLTK